MREAELHDGTVLEFPDETTDEVIQAAVKRHLGLTAPAAPAAPTRNQAADARSAELRKQIADVEEEAAIPARDFAGPASGAVTGMAPTPDAAAVLQRRAELKKQRDDLQAEHDRLNLGTTGQTVGGMTGAVIGGGLGAALTRNPTGAAAGARLGAAVAGAALGTGAGTALKDIPAAQEARDISDAEAAQIIRGRMVESLIWDGAFTLVFGPGRVLLGKITDGEKFLPALRAVAKDGSSWGALPDGAQQQMAKIVAQRAESAPPGIATQASDALKIPTGVTDKQAMEKLIVEISKTTGGRLPTEGTLKGVAGRWEGWTRSLAPRPFVENDKILAETAEVIRREALGALDTAGAHDRIGFGNAVREVIASADAALKRVTGPVFDRAAAENVRVDMRGTRKSVEQALFEDLESAQSMLGAEERLRLERLLKSLTDEPWMSMQGLQNFVSGQKAYLRDTQPNGAKPGTFARGVVGKIAAEADAAFLAAAAKAEPQLGRDLRKARNLYRTTIDELHSDSMAKALNDIKTPEDVMNLFTVPGTVTEIRELRTALNRAATGAGTPPRWGYPARASHPSELSKERVLAQRQRIDAGLIKGFIEQNTRSLADLETQFTAPKFKDTVKEILVGEGAANPALGRTVLAALDRTMGLAKLAKPDAAPQPGRVIIPGVSTNVSAGSAGASVTGSFRGAVPLIMATILSGVFLSRATATAMTTGNTGVFRTIQRAAALAPNAGKSAAAAEALRGVFLELDSWDRANGGPGLPELSAAP